MNIVTDIITECIYAIRIHWYNAVNDTVISAQLIGKNKELQNRLRCDYASDLGIHLKADRQLKSGLAGYKAEIPPSKRGNSVAVGYKPEQVMW